MVYSDAKNATATGNTVALYGAGWGLSTIVVPQLVLSQASC